MLESTQSALKQIERVASDINESMKTREVRYRGTACREMKDGGAQPMGFVLLFAGSSARVRSAAALGGHDRVAHHAHALPRHRRRTQEKVRFCFFFCFILLLSPVL